MRLGRGAGADRLHDFGLEGDAGALVVDMDRNGLRVTLCGDPHAALCRAGLYRVDEQSVQRLFDL